MNRRLSATAQDLDAELAESLGAALGWSADRDGDGRLRLAPVGAPPAPRNAPEREPGDWRERAACLTADPDLFFPISDSGTGVKQEEKAKAVCARCPVQSECLAFAQRTAETDGIWGGQTPRERLLTAGARPRDARPRIRRAQR